MNWPTTEVVWAPDVVQQPDGTFRYYYCEPCNINIGESTSPVGPWKNILGKDDAVMVPDRYVHNVITLDPQLFRDDDGSEYLLLRSVYQERPLQVNEAVDPEEYSRWVTLRQYRSALEKAVSLLAVRARGQWEIEQKLKSAGYAPETVEMVVLKLTREGFLVSNRVLSELL